jgi:hypothetical protein
MMQMKYPLTGLLLVPSLAMLATAQARGLAEDQSARGDPNSH